LFEIKIITWDYADIGTLKLFAILSSKLIM